MTRQAQNMVLGGLAFAVGIVAIAAMFLLVTDDGSSTSAGGPLGPSAGSGAAVESSADGVATSTGDTIGSNRPELQPLAVPLTSAPMVEQTTTSMAITTSTVVTTTTAAPVTMTTAAPTTTTTAAPSTTAAETTVAETDTDTETPGGSDTTDAPDMSTPANPDPDDPDPDPDPTDPDPTTTTTTAASATTTTTIEAPAPTQPPTAAGLNDVELEIARLTNELRTNPNGPMRREGPVIDCGGRVLVSNGQYDPIGAVQISEVASIQVARPWSAQMTRSNFKHQERAGVPALQAAGIDVRSAGENIAYHSYSNKAMVHFEGWRESDGHFCNMMDPGFTHLGVGEVSKSDGISYATQNFFSTR